MKLYLNIAPEKAWKYIAVCLLAGFTNAHAQQANPIYTVYNNETEIKGTQSVTLKDGFHIPAGKTVRIFTGASFKECVPFLSSLSADQNYISTRIFKMPKVSAANIDSARSTCEVNQTVQYFDGLGRPLQTVTTQGSPTFQDVVQPVAYDAFGREQFKYLPYVDPGTAGGAYKGNAFTSGQGVGLFYNPPNGIDPQQPNGIVRTAFPFSETRFEASPLNRVLEQGALGASWQLSGGHTQKMEYGSNNASAAYSTIGFAVRLYTAVPVMATGQEHQRTLSGTGYYGANELYLTISKDENWISTDGKAGTTEEYKDKEGRVVLKRLFNRKPDDSIETLSTYYVYDELGNLSFVLPPGANPDAEVVPSPTTQDNFCYQYRYDGRKRLIEKKIPGKGWEDMVYNKLDQLVLSRDAEQRNSNKWLFTKYDALGRAVMIGMHSNATERVNLQPIVDAQGALWENRDNSNSNGTGTGYSNVSLPNTAIDAYLTINYYDDYEFYGNNAAFNATTVKSNMTKSLATGSKVNVLESNTMLLTVTYYDNEGQVIETVGKNHLEGMDRVINTWNFAGELTASTRTHTGSASGPATTIATRYDYDHMGRKLATMQSINGQPEVVLSKMAYNEIGQLLKKELHSKDNGSSFLQKTDYAYNERGWLKNNISNQFSFKLDYDDGVNQGYNGNITKQSWDWINTVNPTAHIFNYAYDRLNRLTSGVNVSLNMSEHLTYDVMGNIASMNRDGAGISGYSYTGNKLNSISGPLATGNYIYDRNGNATTDGRKAVTIGYNILNLPLTVSKPGVLSMSYTYDATGTKLKKVSSLEATSDYVDGIQYTGGVIDFIMTEEGKAKNNGGNYVYEYNLTDHLGNVRYTFNQHPSTFALQQLQADNYYPFGKQKVASAGVNKYLYNGKELQNELGQLDYGARFYDPEIGRWNVVDPLANDYDDVSPYNYVLNNPIKFIDPDGMRVEDGPSYLASTYVGPDGRIIRHDNDNDKNIYLVSDPSKWDGTKDNLTVIGSETPGVSYNQVGQYIAKIGFDARDLKEVQITGGATRSMVLGALVRTAAPQGIGQSFALDALMFPQLRLYFGTLNIINAVLDAPSIVFAKEKGEELPAGFKETNEFGRQHGQKVYKKGNKYYSKDVDGHNGGKWKVFEKQGTKLKRVGTADKDLNIFKR